MNRGLTPDQSEDGFPYQGFEVRGTARLLDIPYGQTVRRIATRYVGEQAAGLYDDSHGGTVVRIEPGESRGWDFRDDLQAMGVL